jgi:hypothetical protein
VSYRRAAEDKIFDQWGLGKYPNKQNGKFRLRAEFFIFEQSCTGLHCLQLFVKEHFVAEKA